MTQGMQMKRNQRRLAHWLCAFGVGIALLVAHSNDCGAAEPGKARNDRPVPLATVGACTVVMGEIRGASSADGTRLKCSEVLNLPDKVTIRSVEVYRNAYVVNTVDKTFSDGTSSMEMPRGTFAGGERGMSIGGGVRRTRFFVPLNGLHL